MSRTLARIRATTGDDILVRTGRTMTPTPRALAMRDEVRTLGARGNRGLAPARTVDPAPLRRTFTIQGPAGWPAALFQRCCARRPPRRPRWGCGCWRRPR